MTPIYIYAVLGIDDHEITVLLRDANKAGWEKTVVLTVGDLDKFAPDPVYKCVKCNEAEIEG